MPWSPAPHGDLALAVRTQIIHLAVLAHLGQALCQLVCQADGHGHQLRGLVAGITEHHALVARADRLVRISRIGAVLDLPRLVDALSDVGRLLVDGVHHAARRSVEAVLGAVVTDLGHHVAHDSRHVDVRLGADLAGHHDGAGGDERLARATNLRHVCGLPVRSDVSLALELDLLRENRIEDGVGNLVAHLIGMTLGHRFGREQVRFLHFSHEVFLLHRCRRDHLDPRPGWCRDQRANSLPRLWINGYVVGQALSQRKPSNNIPEAFDDQVLIRHRPAIRTIILYRRRSGGHAARRTPRASPGLASLTCRYRFPPCR